MGFINEKHEYIILNSILTYVIGFKIINLIIFKIFKNVKHTNFIYFTLNLIIFVLSSLLFIVILLLPLILILYFENLKKANSINT